ncbi:MAG TPA: hypothetical protein VFK60_04770 [Casimicrobiaceae bacterium]|jgi:lauroyl/myristoyl acyltransferase|nr:hypothetical protein [Casimicrobiaceae bacterium]
MSAINWTTLGAIVVLVLLVLLVVRLIASDRQRKIRKVLGLPAGRKLGAKEAQAMRAFEDTDIKLRKTFPKMSETQRQGIARDVLRDKGVLPKKK